MTTITTTFKPGRRYESAPNGKSRGRALRLVPEIEVYERTGLSYRAVREARELGIIAPVKVLGNPRKHGEHRFYALADLRRLVQYRRAYGRLWVHKVRNIKDKTGQIPTPPVPQRGLSRVLQEPAWVREPIPEEATVAVEPTLEPGDNTPALPVAHNTHEQAMADIQRTLAAMHLVLVELREAWR